MLGPVNGLSSLNSEKVNVVFFKHGIQLSDRQMEQFLRLEGIDIDKR